MTWKDSPFQLVRMAAASIAVDFIQPRHRIAQAVLLIVAIGLAWQEIWWAVALVVVVMLGLFLAYLLVVKVINWVGTPKALRKLMTAVQDDVRAEYERLGLPVGPIASARFAFRLARGKRPHAELLATLPEAMANIQRILDTALRDAGLATETP